MKSWLSLLTIILVISAVSAFAAADGQYVVVLGRDAPSSDAVIGANFAASMKATLGVTFTSAIDTDLYAQDAELGSRTFVVIDGEERKIRILGTSNAAAAAESYFQRLGFDTELRAATGLEDLLVDPSTVEDADQDAQDADDEIDADAGDIIKVAANVTTNQTAFLEATDDPEQDDSAQDADLPPSDPLPQIEPQERSVFSRVLSWFKELF